MRTNLVITLTLILAIFCCKVESQADENQILNHAILVNVNGNKITRSQLDTMGKILFKMNFPGRDEKSINEAELELLSTNALKELITIFLTEDEYDKIMNDENPNNDFKIKSRDVDREIRNMNLGKLKNQPLAERYARSKVMRRNIVYSTRSGMDASPREVKRFYLKNRDTVFTEQKKIRIRELFLSSDASNDSLSKKQAMMLYNNLKSKSVTQRLKLFPEMAREFSRDRFAAKGGLLVTGTPGNFFPQEHNFKRPDGSLYFPQEMIQAIHDLNAKGDIIITKSNKGWHIIILEAIRGGKKIPFNKVKNIIENYLADNTYEEAYYDWLKTKVARNRITWNDGDPFPPDKITSKPNQEESLRYLRNQLQNYMEEQRKPKNRR